VRFAIGMTLAVVAMAVIGVAATTRTQVYPTTQALYSFDAITVDSNGYTDVTDEIPVFTMGPKVGLRVCDVGTNALGVDGFQILIKMDPDQEDWDTWLSGTDFDTATTILRSVSTTGPHEIGSNGCAWAIIDAAGVWSIKAQASANTDPTTVTVRATVGGGVR